MSLIFPSEQWVAAWVSTCNRSPDFSVAAAGWSGAIALQILDPPASSDKPLIFRLEGANGQWTSFEMGSAATLTAGTTFSLRASYPVWQSVIRQEIHPVKGIIQGRLRVTGQLSEVLRWSSALTLVSRLAGDLDTTFEEA